MLFVKAFYDSCFDTVGMKQGNLLHIIHILEIIQIYKKVLKVKFVSWQDLGLLSSNIQLLLSYDPAVLKNALIFHSSFQEGQYWSSQTQCPGQNLDVLDFSLTSPHVTFYLYVRRMYIHGCCFWLLFIATWLQPIRESHWTSGHMHDWYKQTFKI